MAPRIVANILCHNDLIYLQNLIPQVQKFADRIIVVDDCSTDGTKEYLNFRTNVERIERKFELNFSDQRNAALQEVENGDWVFRIDSDEIPTEHFRYIKQVIEYCESIKCNRLTASIFHMINMTMCKLEVGAELRLFKKNDSCLYVKPFHELIHGEFGEGTSQLTLPDWFSLIHMKYADRNKIEYTKSFFIKNGLYAQEDLDRRIDMEATFLPPSVKYYITPQLENYLCMKNI